YTAILGCLLMIAEYILGGPGPVSSEWPFLLTPFYTFLIYVFVVMGGEVYPTFEGLENISAEESEGKPEDDRKALKIVKKHTVSSGLGAMAEYLFLKKIGKHRKEEEEFTKLDVSLETARIINASHKKINYLIFTPVVITAFLLIGIQTIVLGLEYRTIAQLMAPGIIVLGYLLYKLRLLFGGADAKAVMSLGVLAYYYPELTSFPVLQLEESIGLSGDSPFLRVVFPFALVVLVNAVILTFFLCFVLLVFNIIRGDFSPKAFLGWKVRLKDARTAKHVWLMDVPLLTKNALPSLIRKLDTEKEQDKEGQFKNKGRNGEVSDTKIRYGTTANLTKEKITTVGIADAAGGVCDEKAGKPGIDDDKENAAIRQLETLLDEEAWKKIDRKYLKMIDPAFIQIKTVYFARRERLSDEEEAEQYQRQLDLLEAAGRKTVWITPQIPFMVPLLLGWVTAFVIGNIMFWFIFKLFSMFMHL
ncbi:MAG: A24 family peptidase C-terminal domain-containing protein, partial [Thermoplasmata archaeon]